MVLQGKVESWLKGLFREGSGRTPDCDELDSGCLGPLGSWSL